MTRWAIAGWVAVVIALLSTLAGELGAFRSQDLRAAPRAQAAPPPGVGESTPDRRPEWVATILARPLFNPDRRSAELASVNGRTPGGLPRLSGTMIGPFGRSAIFIADGRKPLVVAEGAHVDAWTVQAIDAGTVRVNGPGGVRTLHPTFQGSPATPQRAGLPAGR